MAQSIQITKAVHTHIRHNIETSDRLVINNINYLITKQYSAGET